MNFAAAESVVRAVLYEGYALYPYRPSSVKNRHRWMFGGLSPGESCQTECLIEGGSDAELTVRVRFLEMLDRNGDPVAVERDVPLGPVRVSILAEAPQRLPFSFAPAIEGEMVLSASLRAEGLHRLTARVENRGRTPSILASTHILLGTTGGRFVSLVDPPPSLSAEAEACRQKGLWPVLLGSPEARDLALASPIILYDFPRTAPESSGDLFDGCEIDEILSLRILTLTDEEKRQARASDPRVKELLDRVEALTPEQLAALHGRGTRALRAGDRVRIAPRGRADAFDLLLAGKTATVVSLEEDVEGQRYVTVAVDDDPGKELAASGQPGHRFFFRRDEVVPL